MRFWNAAILLALTAAVLWAGGTSADGPLTLEGRTTSSLTVSWSWNGQTASAYELAWWARGDDEAAAWRSVRKTAAQRRHTIEGLDAGVHYVIRVRALGFDDRPLASLQGTFATNSAVEGQPLDPRLLRGLAERLTLELASSRELCTAGTLTEISWQINGGKPPYTLQVEDSPANADAENIRINCGALSAVEAADEEAALAAKRVTAVVTDARGVRREATIDVARVRALPAPEPRTPSANPTSIGTSWVADEGKNHGVDVHWWLIRWRAASAPSDTEWAYRWFERHPARGIVIGGVGSLSQGTAYAFAFAALRDPIERWTPDALRWSRTLEATTAATPTGVTSVATHDTITVTWDDQPSVDMNVEIIRADGKGRLRGVAARRRDADPPNQLALIDLEPATEYRITLLVGGGGVRPLSTTITATTAAAPVGWQPPARGAQNLRTTATHDTITVTWDAPVPNTRDRWIIYIGHSSWSTPNDYWISAPLTFTLEGLTPSTTYSVKVVHADLYGVEVSTTVTTAPVQDQSPPGSAGTERSARASG